MNIEVLTSCTNQDFIELKSLMSQLSERLNLTKADIDRVLSDSNAYIYIMRDSDNHIIASATLSIFNSPSSRKASIEDVIVHSDYRGQHLGKALVKHLISEARHYSPIEIQLTSKPTRIEANNLYQSLDFKRKETNFYKMVL